MSPRPRARPRRGARRLIEVADQQEIDVAQLMHVAARVASECEHATHREPRPKRVDQPAEFALRCFTRPISCAGRDACLGVLPCVELARRRLFEPVGVPARNVHLVEALRRMELGEVGGVPYGLPKQHLNRVADDCRSPGGRGRPSTPSRPPAATESRPLEEPSGRVRSRRVQVAFGLTHPAVVFDLILIRGHGKSVHERCRCSNAQRAAEVPGRSGEARAFRPRPHASGRSHRWSRHVATRWLRGTGARQEALSSAEEPVRYQHLLVLTVRTFVR
jgi:hypothetical protein